MAKKTHKLSAQGVKAETRPGRHNDGDGLYLLIGPTRAKSWVLLYQRDGKRREMGLGALSTLLLAEARLRAADCRKLISEGKDPLEVRKQAQAPSNTPTFGEAADALIASKGHEWRNEKHRAQWVMTLTEYAKSLRAKPVDEVTTADVLAVLKTIWLKKPETASRLRGRIEAVLDAAKAQGHRAGENPAGWRGHLAHLLPKRPKLSRGHHAAMPYVDVPAFVQRLRARDGVAARALEFTVLAAARTGEIIGAQVGEIDIKARVWRFIPPLATSPSPAFSHSDLNTARNSPLRPRCSALLPRRYARLSARRWVAISARPPALSVHCRTGCATRGSVLRLRRLRQAFPVREWVGLINSMTTTKTPA